MPEVWRKGGRKMPELICDICSKHHPIWFTDNYLWNEYSKGYDFLCPTCFISMVKNQSGEGRFYLTTEKTPGEFFERSTATPQPAEPTPFGGVTICQKCGGTEIKGVCQKCGKQPAEKEVKESDVLSCVGCIAKNRLSLARMCYECVNFSEYEPAEEEA